MWYRCLLASALAAILLNSASAQFGGSGSGNLRVRVLYENDDHSAPKHLMVQLMTGPGSSPVANTYTNDSGFAEFGHLSVGEYHVVVSGDGIVRADSGMFDVDPRKMTQTQYVYVHRSADEQPAAAGNGSMTSASALAVPDGARKEFQKGADAIKNENWNKAEDHLNKAVAAYPQYAAAYNALGVVYAHANNPSREREALEKAIELDEHFAPAYVNLAELCIQQQNAKQAESLLLKAVPLDPTSAKSYLLLADAELLNQKYDAAISSAQKVHTLPHERMALAHFIAARAYEHENRPKDALAELQLFLKEESQGPRADHIREEIKFVQQHIQ